MKRITIILAVAASTISAQGQDFMNLNFESAQNLTNNPGLHGAFTAVTNALPYWTAYNGSNPLSEIFYTTNNPGAGVASAVELVGGSVALSGNFSVFLAAGSISQTGLVPDNTASLQFEAHGAYGPNGSLPPTGFEVALGGQNLSYSFISAEPNYAVYGANIPANLVGQMEPLTFSGTGSSVLLDNIEFLPASVPEPSPFALIGLDAILFALCRRRKIQRPIC